MACCSLLRRSYGNHVQADASSCHADWLFPALLGQDVYSARTSLMGGLNEHSELSRRSSQALLNGASTELFG